MRRISTAKMQYGSRYYDDHSEATHCSSSKETTTTTSVATRCSKGATTTTTCKAATSRDMGRRCCGAWPGPTLGVTGFTGVAGVQGRAPFPAFQRDDYALPYSLRSGDEQILSRWNMIEQKLTVSRVQCVVQVAPDGAATLESRGKGPTLWREPGGPWVALQAGDRVFLGDGHQVA